MLPNTSYEVAHNYPTRQRRSPGKLCRDRQPATALIANNLSTALLFNVPSDPSFGPNKTYPQAKVSSRPSNYVVRSKSPRV